jgi:hypothetical protein
MKKISINAERAVGTVIGLALVAGLILGLRFFLGGEEGTWSCVSGEWVASGEPSGPPPETGCEPPVREPQFVDPSTIADEDLPLNKGRLMRDREGMKPDTWYLRFDLEDGYTWLEVSFADGAVCLYDGEAAACDSLYPPSGAATSFSGGRLGGDKFLVNRLEVVPR